MTVKSEIVGKRFGRLVGLSETEKIVRGRPYRYFICQCDCGLEKEILGWRLTSAKITSCGECQKKPKHRKHGDLSNKKPSKEYNSWAGMKQRCTDPKHKSFNDYGGRGITVCDRWQDYKNFLADMGRKPSPRHSIDRSDNNGNYEPSNCRWALPLEQRLNSRPKRSKK